MWVIDKRGSWNMPQILLKSKEWITILYCMNEIGFLTPEFFLFMDKTQLKSYIQNYE